jgi:hypothetical protein
MIQNKMITAHEIETWFNLDSTLTTTIIYVRHLEKEMWCIKNIELISEDIHSI